MNDRDEGSRYEAIKALGIVGTIDDIPVLERIAAGDWPYQDTDQPTEVIGN